MSAAIAVTALGMASSFGYDVVHACAAFRAGMSRATELSSYAPRRRRDGRREPIAGHAAPEIPPASQGEGRLVALAWPALRSLLDAPAARGVDRSRSAFHLATHVTDRTHATISPAWRTSASRKGATETTDAPQTPAKPSVRLCERLDRIGDLGVPSSRWQEFPLGRAAFASALSRAIERLITGGVDHCFVGAVDSLLDTDTLRWLDGLGRLKTSERASGLQPGEAAVFALVEREETARSRGAAALSILQSAVVDHEPNHFFSAKPARGRGLARATHLALAAANCLPKDAAATWPLVDHNGETYSAEEWGYALVRLNAGYPGFGSGTTQFPAASFGDTGAASGAVALAAATRAFVRGYAPARRAVLLSSSETGQRGAVVLAEPSGGT